MPQTVLTRPAEQFWAKARRDELTGCLLWVGAKRGRAPRLYGNWTDLGKNVVASRAAWIYTYGPIPDGLGVLHHCDTPLCVEPGHLFLGTAKDNAEDRQAKGRGTDLRGEKHHCARLTDEEIAEIRAATGTGKEVAARFGISQPYLWRLRAGLRRAG